MAKSSKRKTNKIENIADNISDLLSSYSEGITKEVKLATDNVMKTMVKDTKRDAKVRRGRYKKSIASKVVYENEYKKVRVWYVKDPEYRLAHLLNNGHFAKNKKTFIKGDKHISKNEYKAVKEFEKRVKEVVSNEN